MDSHTESELRAELERLQERIAEMPGEMKRKSEVKEREVQRLTEEVSQLNDRLRKEKEIYTLLWCLNNEHLIEYDETITIKEEEIRVLKSHVLSLEAASDSVCEGGPTPTRRGSGRGEAVVSVSDPGRCPTHSSRC